MLEAIQRTKYSVAIIEKAGIKTQQVSLEIFNWLEDVASNDILENGDKWLVKISSALILDEVTNSNNNDGDLGTPPNIRGGGYHLQLVYIPLLLGDFLLD